LIKLANSNHLNDILHIENMVFDKPWSRKQLQRDLILNDNTENWVYVKNQKVVGYIIGLKVIDEFHLNNIAVDKNFQHQHIGKFLIEHVIKQLLNRNINKIYLEVSEKNLPAIHLYQSIGFKKIDKRIDYYSKGKHAFVYYLDLGKNV